MGTTSCDTEHLGNQYPVRLWKNQAKDCIWHDHFFLHLEIHSSQLEIITEHKLYPRHFCEWEKEDKRKLRINAKAFVLKKLTQGSSRLHLKQMNTTIWCPRVIQYFGEESRLWVEKKEWRNILFFISHQILFELVYVSI